MLPGGDPGQSGESGGVGARNGGRTLNLAIALVLICANMVALFLGGYLALKPLLFLAGLACASAATLWMAWRLRTWEFLALLGATVGVAIMDEYVHTLAGIFTYFDRLTPSPLAVLGWGPFVMLIVLAATYCHGFIPFKHEARRFGVGLPLISIVMIAALAKGQGYLEIIGWPLILVYTFMGLASLYYCYNHTAAWGLSLMACSLGFGGSMEYLGSVEGMWSFRFNEPLCLFMVFTWALRVWTVLAICYLLDMEPADQKDKR